MYCIREQTEYCSIDIIVYMYGYPPAPMGYYENNVMSSPGYGPGYMGGPVNPIAGSYQSGYENGCLKACAACMCL